MAVSSRIIRLAALGAVVMVGVPGVPSGTAAEHASFKNQVMPIIREKCLGCHQPGGQGYEASGLDLRSYEGLMKGTKYGPVVVPGDTLTSNLNVLIEGRAAPYLRMPYHGKELSKWERHLFRVWVSRGAKNN